MVRAFSWEDGAWFLALGIKSSFQAKRMFYAFYTGLPLLLHLGLGGYGPNPLGSMNLAFLTAPGTSTLLNYSARWCCNKAGCASSAHATS